MREREDTVSEVVKKLGITYAYYFNKKYGRSGHLFQDRFRRKITGTVLVIISFATIKLPNYSDEK